MVFRFGPHARGRTLYAATDLSYRPNGDDSTGRRYGSFKGMAREEVTLPALGSPKQTARARSLAKANVARQRKAQRDLERRARWIFNEFVRDPTYTYAEMIDAVRERFECGYTAAEKAYARAGELERESWQNLSAERLVNLYFEVLDEARAAGKYVAACRIIDSIYDKTGMSAPTKHELSVNASAHTMQRMAHVNVLAMTPTQRAQREAELTAKAALHQIDDASVLDVDDKGNVTAPPDDVAPEPTPLEALDAIPADEREDDGGDGATE